MQSLQSENRCKLIARWSGSFLICIPHSALQYWLPLLVMLQLSLFQRQVCRLPHSAAKVVARAG